MERLFYRTIVANNGGRPMVAPTNIIRFFTVTVGANCVRPPLFTIIAYFRDAEDVIPYKESKTTRDFTHFQSEVPFSRVIHNNFCRGRRPRRPVVKNFTQYRKRAANFAAR